MRLKPQQIRYVASKIGIDLANAPFVTLPKGKDVVVEVAKTIIDENFEKEKILDEKVKEIIEENYEEIEFQHANERQLFFMIKKKIADEHGVIMNYEDRYNELSHQILDELYEESLAEYSVSDNRIKNVIFNSFISFADVYDAIDTIVYEKIKKMEKNYIQGTQEYELIYEKLYQEELIKRGML